MNANTMNTEQTAQQLELAAQILRTGHPFMASPKPNGLWCVPAPAEMDILKWPVDKYEIRLALATPPDNRPLHNPDNLTAEQVGAGWRLTLKGERHTQQEYWNSNGQWKPSLHYTDLDTFRLPLSIPWPDPKPDPYAELKQAHAEGKVIQQSGHGSGDWFDCGPDIAWTRPVECYLIKPSFQLPPPPPGMSWHRTDGWKDGDLPQSHRPLVLEEHSTNATQQRYSGGWIRITDSVIADPLEEPMRTRRPLTFTHEGKTWTWHRPGDPMPCDKEARIHYLDTKESCYGPEKASELFDDFGKNHPWPIIGWRYAEIETKNSPAWAGGCSAWIGVSQQRSARYRILGSGPSVDRRILSSR